MKAIDDKNKIIGGIQQNNIADSTEKVGGLEGIVETPSQKV